jgi:two-component system response regulator CpxR
MIGRESMIAHLLIMDDEPELIDSLVQYLRNEGYKITVAKTGEAARSAILKGDINIALIDVEMATPEEIQKRALQLIEAGADPFVCQEGEGLSVAAWIRQHMPNTGIAIISKYRTQTKDIIDGLERGADDYISKDRPPQEIAARLRAILKRTIPLPKDRISFAGFELNITSRKLHLRHGDIVELTGAEFCVLRALIDEPEIIISRASLHKAAFGHELGSGDGRGVDTLISKLRKKMGVGFEDLSVIKTIRGLGYRLDATVEYHS